MNSNNTLMKGWTVVVEQPPSTRRLGKAQMAEDAVEFLAHYELMKAFLRKLERLHRHSKHVELPASMRHEGRVLLDILRNSERAWIRAGAWPPYYQTPNGTVHVTLGCKTINERTVLRPIRELSGAPVSVAMARGYRVCAHCLKDADDRDASIRKVRRFCDRWTTRLEGMMNL